MRDTRLKNNSTPLAWLILVTIAIAEAPAAMPSRAVLTVHGAAGRVSGSLAVLDTGNGRWMIDCGSFYPEEDDSHGDREERAARESAELPIEGPSISALVATHAHLDHIGRVPLLVDRGFSGPICLTRATAEIAGPMLEMQIRFDRGRVRTWTWSKSSRARSEAAGRSLYVHWRPCPYRQGIAPDNLESVTCTSTELPERISGQRPVKPFLCQKCSQDEVGQIARRFRRVEYRTPTELAPGVRVTLVDAGHVPGSASALFEVELPAGTRRILFSGDLGNDLSALFGGPEPAPDAHVVVLESTYGTTRRDPAVRGHRAAFRQAVGEAVRAGGIVWIPAFAFDRTQKVLYELHLAQREGLLPEQLPIFCPSPTAAAITEIYRKNRQAGWFRDDVAADPLAFEPREIRKTVPSSLPRPSILISPSDMTTAAWSEKLLERLLPEPSTWVLLVGYQDPFGEGGRLKAGAASLPIRGREIPVRAQVRSFDGFSGHGDAADLDRWLSDVPRTAKLILVHGGTGQLHARVAELNAAGRKAVAAAPGAAIDL